MKRLFTIVTLLTLIALTLSAQPAPQAVTGEDVSAFLVPIAGRVVGVSGTTFRTDLTIVNFGDADQRVELEWISRAGTNARAEVTIPYLSYQTLHDVVGSSFELTELGAIFVRGIDETGAPDPAAQIDGYARIWTTVETDPRKGSASQSLVPMKLEGWRSDSPAYVHGVRLNGQFRTNYGIVNLDRDHARTFKVLVNSPVGKMERIHEIAPFSMVLESIPYGPWGDLSVYVEPLGSGGDWRAFASTVDNSTQSGWIVPAVQPRIDVIYPEP